MSGEDYREAIGKSYPDEDADDLVFMIETLAQRRANELGIELTDEVYDFAAKVICVILDPLKDDTYRQDIAVARSRFKGVATSPSMAELFSAALTKDLLTASSASSAIAAGVSILIEAPEDLDEGEHR